MFRPQFYPKNQQRNLAKFKKDLDFPSVRPKSLSQNANKQFILHLNETICVVKPRIVAKHNRSYNQNLSIIRKKDRNQNLQIINPVYTQEITLKRSQLRQYNKRNGHRRTISQRCQKRNHYFVQQRQEKNVKSSKRADIKYQNKFYKDKLNFQAILKQTNMLNIVGWEQFQQDSFDMFPHDS